MSQVNLAAVGRVGDRAADFQACADQRRPSQCSQDAAPFR